MRELCLREFQKMGAFGRVALLWLLVLSPKKNRSLHRKTSNRFVVARAAQFAISPLPPAQECRTEKEPVCLCRVCRASGWKFSPHSLSPVYAILTCTKRDNSAALPLHIINTPAPPYTLSISQNTPFRPTYPRPHKLGWDSHTHTLFPPFKFLRRPLREHACLRART